MKPRLLTVTFVFAGLILLSRSVHAAGFCLEPGFARGVAGAEMIFTGRITKVEEVEASTVPPGTYFVTFKVENTWKGKPADEVRVLWRSRSFGDCPDLPVGEVGEDYLVYADPSRSTTMDQSPEVTVFNRTSRLPSDRKPENYLLDDWDKPTRISSKPDLNRADASNDIELLGVLRVCSCLSNRDVRLPPDQLPSFQPTSEQTEGVSVCQPCLRRKLKPF